MNVSGLGGGDLLTTLLTACYLLPGRCFWCSNGKVDKGKGKHAWTNRIGWVACFLFDFFLAFRICLRGIMFCIWIGC